MIITYTSEVSGTPQNEWLVYHIAGNFRMVQNFAVFADRSAAVKLRTANFSSSSCELLIARALARN